MLLAEHEYSPALQKFTFVENNSKEEIKSILDYRFAFSCAKIRKEPYGSLEGFFLGGGCLCY